MSFIKVPMIIINLMTVFQWQTKCLSNAEQMILSPKVLVHEFTSILIKTRPISLIMAKETKLWATNIKLFWMATFHSVYIFFLFALPQAKLLNTCNSSRTQSDGLFCVSGCSTVQLRLFLFRMCLLPFPMIICIWLAHLWDKQIECFHRFNTWAN